MLQPKEVAPQDNFVSKSCSAIVGSQNDCSSGLDLPSPEEDASTAAPSCIDTSSEISDEDHQIKTEAIPWCSIKYGKRIRPVCGHAHCADDIYLLSAYLELAQLPDIDSDSAKLVLKALALLRSCNYSFEDICSILAHASSYFEDTHACCGSRMDANEIANVLVMVMFVANSYVQDVNCPLHVWHRHLFQKYCSLHTLNAAIISLLKVRGFVLRVKSQDLSRRYAILCGSSKRNRIERKTGHEELLCITFRQVVTGICSVLPSMDFAWCCSNGSQLD